MRRGPGERSSARGTAGRRVRLPRPVAISASATSPHPDDRHGEAGFRAPAVEAQLGLDAGARRQATLMIRRDVEGLHQRLAPAGFTTARSSSSCAGPVAPPRADESELFADVLTPGRAPSRRDPRWSRDRLSAEATVPGPRRPRWRSTCGRPLRGYTIRPDGAARTACRLPYFATDAASPGFDAGPATTFRTA